MKATFRKFCSKVLQAQYIFLWLKSCKEFFFSTREQKTENANKHSNIIYFDVILEMLNLIDVDIFSLTLQNKLWSFSVWDFTGSKFHPIREVKKSRLVQVFLFLTGCKIIEIYTDWLDIVAALFQIDRFIGRHWF